MKYSLSNHALEKIQKRKISKELIDSVMQNPQQTLFHGDITIYQSKFTTEQKEYLLRIFVNTKKVPNVIITVYLTNKVTKYWMQP